jgi:hypothetical protein
LITLAFLLMKEALDVRTPPDATPAEFMERYSYGLIIGESGKVPEVPDQYKRTLQLPVCDEEALVKLYVNIAHRIDDWGQAAGLLGGDQKTVIARKYFRIIHKIP